MDLPPELKDRVAEMTAAEKAWDEADAADKQADEQVKVAEQALLLARRAKQATANGVQSAEAAVKAADAKVAALLPRALPVSVDGGKTVFLTLNQVTLTKSNVRMI